MDRDVFNGCGSVTIYCEALSMPCKWDCLWNSSFGPVVWGYAGEFGITEDGFKYAVCKDKSGSEYIYITGYDVNRSHNYYNDLSIPEDILVGDKEMPVKFISEYAFRDCSSLRSLVIPSSVTSIGDRAFKDCKNLTSITIPGSVTSIKGYLFYGCDNLSSITISDGVTTIEEYAFRGLQSLASITIHASVTSIGDHAFQGCKSLTSIAIPGSVTSIGREAFSGCDSATIYCDVSSKPKGWDILWNSSARPVVWGYTGESGVTKDGFKYAVSKDQNGNESICIIGYDSTGYHGYYEDLSIPRSILVGSKKTPVKFISNGAFLGCNRLRSIIVPGSISSIGNAAFSNCINLSKITISEGVSSIGSAAFYNCISLKSITIPSSVTLIESCVFGKCKSLTSITIPDSVTSIGNFAFAETGLASITIPDSVTSIWDAAFFNCPFLKSVTIPSSVTLIGNHVFDIKTTVLRE